MASYQGYGSKAELDNRQQIARALMAQSVQGTPNNVGEGLSAISKALFGMLASRANQREEGARTEADRGAYDAYLGGMGQPQAQPAPHSFAAPQPAGGDIYSAIEHVESRGNPNAVSPVGATGAMQIMPATARDPGFGVRNIFDQARGAGIPVPDESDATLDALLRNPDLNRQFGRQYFDAMKSRHGSDELALAAYNAGPGAVDQHGGIPPYEETQNYVRQVSERLGQPQQGAQPQMSQPSQQPGGIDPRLLDLAGREYLTPQQQMVVQSLLQKQLAGDPKGTSAQREYEMAVRQGFGGSFMDYRRELAQAGRANTNVSINTGGEKDRYVYGTDAGLPAGWRIDRQTGEASPIPGGPAAVEQSGNTRALDLASADYDRKFNIVDSSIDKALGDIDRLGRFVAGAGSVLSGLPETGARNFKATLETIKANLGFEELQAMRDSSPTGGALGQVTERELAFLQAVQGNLDAAQSPDQLRAVLEDIKRRRAEFRAERRRIMGAEEEAPAAEPTIEELMQKYGSD